MVVGVFLRNIKSYDKTFFIPIVKNNKPYSFFIGENGVGKSSIIEALDIYFNKRRDWNIHNNNKNKDEVFIAPVHLIKKAELNLKEKHLKYLESISNTLLNWDIDTTNHMKNEWTKNFYNFLIELKELNNIDSYYILISPLHYSKNYDKYLFVFDKLIKDNIEDYDESVLKDLIEVIKSNYSYIYIPVETPIDEVLRMETPEMQQLVKEDILKYTENVLNDKNIQDGRKQINIVDKINNKLEEFMIDINYTITTIDDSYSYSADGKNKKSLTAVDIREQIFKAFFSIRSLSKNSKSIEKLSSGEKRKALIDISTAFLKQESKRNKNVILAIDEPETSMHMKTIFKQFKQLEDLAINYDVQFIGTTHWYGFLPITDYGNLNHIAKEESLNVRNFDFFNLFERNDSFPDDIEMKSFFELVTSILTSIKTSDFNKWIICEGSDDKKYLEYYLKYKSSNKNLIILPVSGCGNVRKLYNLLYASLSEKDKVKIKGKILCLIDTDLNLVGLENNMSSDKDKIIFLRRLQLNKNDCTLEKIGNSQLFYQTEVEDCLEPNKYCSVLKEISKNTDFEDIFNSHTINEDCKISRIKEHNNGGTTLFEVDDNATGLSVKKFKNFIEFIEKTDIKQKICNRYISVYDSVCIPSWITMIIQLLELDEIEIPNTIDSSFAEFEDIKNETDNEDSISMNQIHFNGEFLKELNISEIINEQDKINDDNNIEEIDNDLKEIINIINSGQQNVLKHSKYIETYISDNKDNNYLTKFLSSELINLSKNFTLMKIIPEIDIKITFPIVDLIRSIDLFLDRSFFYQVLIIIFKNENNIQDNDLNYIIQKLNSSEIVNNSYIKNEYYFLIYATLKLNNYDEIKTILSNQSLINIINSIFVIIYFSHYDKYIKIGNQLDNLVSFSNNIMNTKSLEEFFNIFIHALKKYKVFEKLIKLDKKKTFMKKLTNYYVSKPKQNNEFNLIFNKIFNNFEIE